MSDTTLRARGASEIVDAAFKLYTRHMGQYVLVAGIAYAPALIAMLILRPGATPPDPTDMAAVSSMFTGYMITMVISLVAIALMNGTVTALGARAYLGEEVDVAAAVRQALPRVPVLIVSALLLGVLYFFGLLLLILPFFYIAARFFGVVPAVVLERQGVFGAFGRSLALSKGNTMHVLGALFLLYGIYIVGSFAVSAIGVLLGNFLVVTLLSTLYTIVAFPIVGLGTMVLYYDTRIRNEGYDLQRMTEGLGNPGATIPR